jgi:hypothetical protein
MSDDEELYTKFIDLDEIYNFLVLSFLIEESDMMLKNNIKFQEHNNCVLMLITLEE